MSYVIKGNAFKRNSETTSEELKVFEKELLVLEEKRKKYCEFSVATCKVTFQLVDFTRKHVSMLTSDMRMFSDKLKKIYFYFFYTVLYLALCCGHN